MVSFTLISLLATATFALGVSATGIGSPPMHKFGRLSVSDSKPLQNAETIDGGSSLGPRPPQPRPASQPSRLQESQLESSPVSPEDFGHTGDGGGSSLRPSLPQSRKRPASRLSRILNNRLEFSPVNLEDFGRGGGTKDTQDQAFDSNTRPVKRPKFEVSQDSQSAASNPKGSNPKGRGSGPNNVAEGSKFKGNTNNESQGDVSMEQQPTDN
ncbi:transmembrane protein, putative, partial [Rhizoctonia solani AG-3 Rhs1AP]